MIQNGLRLGFLPFVGLFGADSVDKSTKTEQDADFKLEETGWDRLKRMFEVDEFGNVSNEVNSVLQVGAMSMFFGGIYGGVMSSRTAYLDFMQNNQATAFRDHLDAKVLFYDAGRNFPVGHAPSES